MKLKLEDKVLVVGVKGKINRVVEDGKGVKYPQIYRVYTYFTLPLDIVQGKEDEIKNIRIQMEEIGINGTINGKKEKQVEVEELTIDTLLAERGYISRSIEGPNKEVEKEMLRQLSKVLEVTEESIKEARERYGKTLLGEVYRVIRENKRQEKYETAKSVEEMPEAAKQQDMEWEGVSDLWVN